MSGAWPPPGPMRRRGPRPLALHLALHPPHEPPHPLIAAIAAYRRHPYARDLPDPPVLWTERDTRLLDYGPAGAPAVVFVPSLVNRATVLDLMQGHSMLRWLAAQGVRPLLLDWGWPGEAERRFGLTDYVAGRLDRALHAAAQAAGGGVAVAGYCMGGLLALAAAARRHPAVARLALLATPWEFARPPALDAVLPAMEAAMVASGTLPVDWLQAAFALVDPGAVARKYLAFARLAQDGADAAHFVALEDWLNDGVPLAAPVARDCLHGWYGANAPGRGAWLVAGVPVDPAALRLPTFVAIPAQDRIVPPDSARPLARLIPGAVAHAPRAGHVGMVAGRRAEAELWRPLRDWLAGAPPH